MHLKKVRLQLYSNNFDFILLLTLRHLSKIQFKVEKMVFMCCYAFPRDESLFTSLLFDILVCL